MSRCAETAVRMLVCCAALCGAQVSRAESIQLMTGGAAKLIYLPVILADRLGYFRREGLDVHVLSSPAGIDTSTELVAGAIQGAVGYYDHTIALQSRGLDVQSVIVLGASAGLIELARRDSGMKTMADAKGHRFGVTGFGSSTFYLTRFLATRAGVPSDAYTIVPLTTEAAFEKALSDGSIDAGMIEEPTATRMLSRPDIQPLADMRSAADTRAQLGGAYAGACLYMRRDWIDAHPNETTHLVRAVLDALRFIQAHNESEVAALVFGEGLASAPSPASSSATATPMPVSLGGNDAALYRQALSITKPTFSTTGQMPAGAPSTALAVLATVDPDVSARHVDIARTYTDHFITDALARQSHGAADPSL